MGHSPHRSGCVSRIVFALLSCSSLRIYFGWCCLSYLCMSFARDSSNRGLLGMLLYMSCSLSSLMFSIVHMVVPSGLCSAVWVGFDGCCVRSYLFVGWVSRFGWWCRGEGEVRRSLPSHCDRVHWGCSPLDVACGLCPLFICFQDYLSAFTIHNRWF